MIIFNSFVTPLSVRTETLQKSFLFIRHSSRSEVFAHFLQIVVLFMCCVLHCSATHCYLCSASSLPGTLELFVGICWREPVCKQWNITIFWKYILFTSNQWNIEAILQYCGDISSSPRRLVFEKPAVTIEHRLLQFLHIANLTRRRNVISNQYRKTKNPNILPSTTAWLHLPWNPVCWDKIW